jgi:leader peptidase (prepilin peptidase) / N-methyltransferase
MDIDVPGIVFPSAIVFIFGAVIGSFLTVCIARLPKGQSIAMPPSHCPHCQKPIRAYDNIPLLSYLWLQGRCRSCAQAISPRYFFVELVTAVLAVILFLRFGLTPAFFIYLVFAAAMVVISFIDLELQIIPDVISLPGIAVGLLASLLHYPWPQDHLSLPPSPLDSLLGILSGGGMLFLVAWLYERATGVEGMGGGDIKLLAMIGAFLGWPGVPLSLFFASLIGSMTGLIWMAITRSGLRLKIPFGPFLCLGALFYLFFGRTLVEAYLGLG